MVLFYLRLARAERGSGRASSSLALPCLRPCAFPASFLCHGRAADAAPSPGELPTGTRPHQTPALFGPPLSQIWPLGSKIEFVRVFAYSLEDTQLPGCGLSHEFSCAVPIRMSALVWANFSYVQIYVGAVDL